MSGEKSEQPTPKKLRDARKKGQVVKSKEVVSTAIILSLIGMLMAMSDYYLEHLGKLMLIPESHLNLPFSQALNHVLENLMQEMAYLCIPILAVSALVVLVSH
ncbi:MAG: EscU/YscU/HrcU family type III secretion system export apparatus switch protein, partial [Aeromonas salmonicida]